MERGKIPTGSGERARLRRSRAQAGKAPVAADVLLALVLLAALTLGSRGGALAEAGPQETPKSPRQGTVTQQAPGPEGNAMDHAAGSGDAHSRDRKPNRLAGESSPYLLLHQYNPVLWYPWGEEALEKARKEDKPIFLSVGYSTCYWCHVMERESFSDPAIAALLNERFVPIKVDREERPDLDEIYMTATQVLTQQGGWPNSVFLTPDLKPFFAGTYFPPQDKWGRPGFATVLERLSAAWDERREEVESSAQQIAEIMQGALEQRVQPAETPPAARVALTSLDKLAARFDETWGGFGGAPKFPTPSNLFLALELAPSKPEAARMLVATLDQMARGGIYDQLAGGFHRYATDAQWKIPHFEKMLYDNGFLLELYAREHGRSGDPQAARIVRETARFLAREMTSEDGALLSAIDAETDGKEGAYYVWTREELERALGADEASFLAPILGFAGEPFFEGDHYVLHLPKPLVQQAKERGLSREVLLEKIAPLRKTLLAARSLRDRPLTDDKVLTDWNGIGIAGLATAGRILEDRSMVAQAEKAATFVLENLRKKGGPLLHTWREGEAKIPAYLADYAFFVRGLLALHEATGEKRWLTAAIELTEEQVQRLRDPAGGFFVAAESPDLLFRSKDPVDGALPSANAIATLNLLALSEKTGEGRWREEAEASLKAFGGFLLQAPDALRMMSVATLRYHGGKGAPAGDSPVVDPIAAGALGSEALNLVEVSAEVGEAREGWIPFRLELKIEEGWHVNANPASAEFLLPTEVRAKSGQLRNLTYPESETFSPAFSEDSIQVYSGQVQIRGQVQNPEDESPTLILHYQACDEERCLPPVKKEISF